MRLREHYVKEGMTERMHKLAGKSHKSTSSFEHNQNVYCFIKHFAEDNALLLPGRVSAFKKSDIQLLPCNVTKKAFG